MTFHEPILTNLRFNRLITPQLVRDVPEERMTEQVGQVVNHAAWQLGHIAVSLGSVAKLIGIDHEVLAGWHEKFDRGSTPDASASGNPSKRELLAELRRVCDAMEAGLPRLDEVALAAATPVEAFRQIAPTVADLVTFVLVTHYSYHLGQLSMWRKAVGLPKALPM